MREVERLSVGELCGQLLVVGFEGESVSAALSDRIRERSIGGVILFRRNIDTLVQTLALCTGLQRATQPGYPIFVGVDQEGGRVARIRKGVLQLPPMRKLGERDDVELTQRVAAELGRQLSLLGFNLDFAPVADVDSNPQNPIISDRSFGSDPARVVRHVRAFSRGLQSQGVIACLKHFPGHGDTSVDSHLALPRVDKSTSELRTVELYPFERACRDANGVMTAHVVFPAFDRQPATLSPRLLGLLRREFSFDGVIFSDDLEMKALSSHWPIEETAVGAIEAGCDVLLVCEHEELQHRALEALIARAENDREFLNRARRAVERSLRLRQRFPQKVLGTAEGLGDALRSGEAEKLETALRGL